MDDRDVEDFRFNATKIMIGVGLRPDLLKSTVDGLISYYITSRHYHDITHVNMMIDNMIKADWYDQELSFAVLFHDVYYIPGNRDNEKLSAKMAEAVLSNCAVGCSITIPMIIETADYMKVRPAKSDCFRKICDLDLSSLALDDYDSFVKQQRNVILEFGSNDLSKSAQFLNELINIRGEHLYYTDYANENWRDLAIKNVTRFVNEYA